MSEAELTPSISEGLLANLPADLDMNFRQDPRVQWLKDRILQYIGMDDEELFYNMLEEGETKQQLATFITLPLKPNELGLEKRTFYVSKIIVDKLIHEDKEFVEWSKSIIMLWTKLNQFFKLSTFHLEWSTIRIR